MLIIDDDEKELIDALELLDVKFNVRDLEEHDFEVIGNNIEIYGEIKRFSDFYLSLIDGRLQKFINSPGKKILIYEFGHSKTCIDKHVNAFVARNVANYFNNFPNVLVVPSCCMNNTANFLRFLDEKLPHPTSIIVPLKKRKDDFRINVLEFLASLPGIGRVKAEEIYQNFSSISDFLSNLEKAKDLIGEGTVEKVINFLNRPFEKNKNP